MYSRIWNKLTGQPPKGTIRHSALRAYVPPNATVVEAGAHVGNDTLQLSRLWRRGTIHAFEPHPTVYAKLKHTTRKCQNVICYPLALGARTGQSSFYVSSGRSDASSSLLKPQEHLKVHPDILFQEEIIVNTITLDDWAIQNQIARVDLLWLDMQGNELAALKAGAEVLKGVSAIYTEVSLKETYAGVPLYPELRAWLNGQAFQVEQEILPWDDMGNVLFVKR